MINLCELTDLRDWLGIEPADNSSDDLLNRLITATSLEFANEIRRPDFAPRSNFTDRIVGSGTGDLYLKHYPIRSISSVTLNGEAQTESDGVTTGWFFDEDLFLTNPEDCQKITFVGSYWPTQCSDWLYTSTPNIIVNYDAGYDEGTIPADVTQAVIEWIGWKRGYAQLQEQNQAAASYVLLGQFQQSVSAGSSTLKASAVVMPDSVLQVVGRYTRHSF